MPETKNPRHNEAHSILANRVTMLCCGFIIRMARVFGKCFAVCLVMPVYVRHILLDAAL